MKPTNTLKVALLALPLALAGTSALAQEDLDAGGFTPEFTDDDLLTYVEAEVDYSGQDNGQLRWDVQSWFGGDYSKLWLTTEGERSDGDLEEAQLQVLYGRYLSYFWDWRVGLRHDLEPDSLNYAVLGIKGLAPGRFDTEGSLFLSEDGDLSLGFRSEYALLLTQRLIAEPYLDLELFAQDVPELGKGAGLSEVGLGVQLRYEIRREFAPYLDVGYTRLAGGTADAASDAGVETEDFAIRAGLRVWY